MPKSSNTLVSILVRAGYTQTEAPQILATILFSESDDTSLNINSSLKDIVDKLGKPEGTLTPSSVFPK